MVLDVFSLGPNKASEVDVEAFEKLSSIYTLTIVFFSPQALLLGQFLYLLLHQLQHIDVVLLFIQAS